MSDAEKRSRSHMLWPWFVEWADANCVDHEATGKAWKDDVQTFWSCFLAGSIAMADLLKSKPK